MVFWILLSNFTYGTGIALSNMVNGSFHYHNLSHFGGEVNLFLYLQFVYESWFALLIFLSKLIILMQEIIDICIAESTVYTYICGREWSSVK